MKLKNHHKYKITLNNLPDMKEIVYTSKKKVILYADFNVLNYFYSNRTYIPSDFCVYFDSTLVYFVLKMIGVKSINRNVSTDFQEKLLIEADKHHKKIYFFGDSSRTLLKLKQSLFQKYPRIIIAGISNGYSFNSNEVIEKINSSDADILLVGLGIGKQEPWILENYKLLNVPMVLSVGGWFRYLSGEKKRAPKIFRSLYLEWFYKLISEFPRIWKRYLIGAPKFIYRSMLRKDTLLKLE